MNVYHEMSRSPEYFQLFESKSWNYLGLLLPQTFSFLRPFLTALYFILDVKSSEYSVIRGLHESSRVIVGHCAEYNGPREWR